MKLVNLIEEDFVNYRKPGMFLGFPYCSGKCNSPGMTVCQNEELHHVPEQDLIDISAEEIVERYKSNPITKCLICGGLEPFDSFDDLMSICRLWWKTFRIDDRSCIKDPVIIYTGYYPHEIISKLYRLNAEAAPTSTYIFVKYGRFIPGDTLHYDPVLGVNLASNNQYAEPLGFTAMKIDYEQFV